MALGTITNVAKSQGDGPLFVDEFTVVGDNPYPTGGSTGLKAKLQGLRKDGRVIIEILKSFGSSVGYSCRYDKTNEKLLVFFEDQTSGVIAEIANGTNLSAITFTLTVVCK